MPTYSARIIVLKKTKLAEMDLIVTGFNSDGQQLRLVVKGGRKPGSRRGSHLELFCQTDIVMHQGRSSMYTVTEAQLVKPHSGCRQDIEHNAAAAAISELVEVLSREADAEPRLFLLLDAALDTLEKTAIAGLELMVAAALLKIIAQVGFQPNLESCLVCGQPFEADKPDTSLAFYFSFEQGGIICADCQAFDQSATAAPAVQPALLSWVALLIKSRFSQLAEFADTEHQSIGHLLLLFARDWMRAQVTPKNRSLDFMLNNSAS
jgi:DNA repair protein RecO (recombination protein O)